MRIKMVSLMAGPDGVRRPGDTLDLPAGEAAALVRGGFAVQARTVAKPVSTETEAGQPELESAALGGPEETATEPEPGRKQKKGKGK